MFERNTLYQLRKLSLDFVKGCTLLKVEDIPTLLLRLRQQYWPIQAMRTLDR